jgi:GYD domain
MRIEEGLGGGQVKWLANYAVLGPYDYLDIFEAPDIEAAMKISAIVRTLGHARTEVWAATEWKRFKEIVRGLPSGGDRAEEVHPQWSGNCGSCRSRRSLPLALGRSLSDGYRKRCG